MTKRALIRLQLEREAKEALDDLCRKRGMTQITALSRLVRWFTRQDEIIQSSVLGALSDDGLRVLARQLLVRLAEPIDGGSDGQRELNRITRP